MSNSKSRSGENVKKLIVAFMTVAFASSTLFGCARASDTASEQVSWAADNFEVVRELTVFDNVTGQILFIAEGRMSIEVDAEENQLEIMVAQPDNKYEKHFVGLNETTTYVVKDINGEE